jgi:hypothetical protein
MAYDFIDQNIVSSCLIQSYTDDSFYNPVVNQHTGFAFDGSYYSLGVLQSTHAKASWYTEFGTNPFRGEQAAFPTFGLALLSPVSLVILDQSKAVAVASSLPLWMQFILGDNNALANNFDSSVQGFLPSRVIYADGIVSVTYTPDAGNQLYSHPTVVASITATSVTANVLTVTASNIFVVGQQVVLSGLTTSTFLNGQTVVVESVIGSGPPLDYTGFTANFTNANYGTTADTGSATATLPIGITQTLDPSSIDFIVGTPLPPYPNVPVQSSMVISIDFTQDSVYLDVAI